MAKNKKKTRGAKKGFTLIEILFVVIIIGILASVILVSLNSARQKARDNGMLSSMKSVVSPAYVCLATTGIASAALTDPSNADSICKDNNGNITGISSKGWPDFDKYDWSKTVLSDLSQTKGFYWCSPSTKLSDPRPVTVGPYADGSMGGSVSAASFCYMLKSGSKYIWCTQDGCRKEGF